MNVQVRGYKLNIKTIRLLLVCSIFGLYILTTLTPTSLGGVPTPNPTPTIVIPTVKPENLQLYQDQIRNLLILNDYCKNETQYYKNLYENESTNTSNKNINDIKNNIITLNQNNIQIYQNIENIQNNIFNLQIMIGITLAITLIGTLIELKVYINKKYKK